MDWLGDGVRVLTDNSDLFVTGFKNTVLLFAIAGVGALLLGTLLAAMRVSPVPALRAVGTLYVNGLRNTPLTLVFFFVVFGFPALDINLTFFMRAVVALTAYTAAFICEAVRAGVNTVPPGQAEAARAVGMTFTQTLGLVVLPQAVRSVIPPIMSILIALAKNTTIAAGFSVAEAGSIRANLSERGEPVIWGLVWVAVGFLIVVLPVSLAQRRLEHALAVTR